MIYSSSPSNGPLRQGELIANLKQYPLSIESVGSEAQATVDEQIIPFSIILSQDCDLDLDYQARNGLNDVRPDKKIPNVLLCEVSLADEVLRPQEGMATTIKNNIIQNKHERYQFLQQVGQSEDAFGEGLAAMVVDFKRYFTIPTTEIYKRLALHARRRCYLNSPYLEHLATRFAYFQMRVALPQNHQS